ncbi:hypothetical protein ACROYT_G017010 [Oculina patagonica]
MLAHVEVGSSWKRTTSPVSLQSFYRLGKGCRGNLLKIHIDGERAQAKCSGRFTRNAKTRFTLMKSKGKNIKCILYTDEQDNNKMYALKFNRTSGITFERHQCGPSTVDAFLFYEEKNSDGKFTYVTYKHKSVVACLLARVEVRSSWKRNASPVSLQSFYRLESGCRGNLLKIHIIGGRPQAKCNGRFTRNPKTRFTIKKVKGKDTKCIQFTDELDGYKRYALKVNEENGITFEVS